MPVWLKLHLFSTDVAWRLVSLCLSLHKILWKWNLSLAPLLPSNSEFNQEDEPLRSEDPIVCLPKHSTQPFRYWQVCVAEPHGAGETGSSSLLGRMLQSPSTLPGNALQLTEAGKPSQSEAAFLAQSPVWGWGRVLLSYALYWEGRENARTELPLGISLPRVMWMDSILPGEATGIDKAGAGFHPGLSCLLALAVASVAVLFFALKEVLWIIRPPCMTICTCMALKTRRL